MPEYVPIKFFYTPCLDNGRLMVPLVDNLPFSPMAPWIYYPCPSVTSVPQVVNGPPPLIYGLRQLVPSHILDNDARQGQPSPSS